MRRVTHLTSAHPRDDTRIFLKECRSLQRHGWDVSLVVADGRGNAVCEDVKVFDVGLFNGRLGRFRNAIQAIYRMAVALDSDVYHLHDPELLLIALRLKRLGKVVIFDSHEDVPRQILAKHYLHPWARRLVSLAFARYQRHVCSQIDGVVAATPFIRDEFLKIQSRTVDVCNFPVIGELESDLAWEDKAAEVCYVGGIAGIRGIRELVSAMERVAPGVRLNLAGAFAESLLEEQVRSSAGWSRVIYHGTLDRAGVRRVLGRSVAGLVTLHPVINYLDALPIKMFEYMAAGIPVIASDFKLWRTIVEESSCGICVDPMDPAAIADAIDFLVRNSDVACRMGRSGREAVKTRFNWTNEEAKLIRFYEQRLQESGVLRG
jgi:glycosyltransferase involved in cell wall biosynthesis